MKTSVKLDAETLAIRFLRSAESGSRAYKRKRANLDALILQISPGDVIRIPDQPRLPSTIRGKLYRLVFLPDQLDKNGRKKTRTNAGLNVDFYDLEEVVEP